MSNKPKKPRINESSLSISAVRRELEKARAKPGWKKALSASDLSAIAWRRIERAVLEGTAYIINDETLRNLAKLLQRPSESLTIKDSIAVVQRASMSGFWRSDWVYATDECADLINIMEFTIGQMEIFGKRVSITGIYEYGFELRGFLLGDQLHLVGMSLEYTRPISVSIVLKPEDHFYNRLTGFAIRPSGIGMPQPPPTEALFHKGGFWVERVAYNRIYDPPSECRRLWTLYQDRFPT
jgi:hypothetical protein